MHSDETFHFKGVTLLVTHYNRTNSLYNLLNAFESLHCKFDEIIVSDDGSRPENMAILEQLQEQFSFRLVKARVNLGLGNNINKGQEAVITPYTLYVQEDFEPTSLFPTKFAKSLQILHENQEIDIVRYYAYFEYPYLTQPNEGFYKMDFKIWKWGYRKFYVYSDHPHLRRSTYFNKFGKYLEGIKGDNTEYSMMMSFLKKNGQALFYKNFNDLFLQKNSQSEPSTMNRDFWRESNNIVVVNIRHIYRHLKFNLDYFR